MTAATLTREQAIAALEASICAESFPDFLRFEGRKGATVNLNTGDTNNLNVFSDLPLDEKRAALAKLVGGQG